MFPKETQSITAKADTGASLSSIGWPNPKQIIDNVKSGTITKQNAINTLRTVASGGGPDAKKAQAVIVRLEKESPEAPKPKPKADVKLPTGFGKGGPPAFGVKKDKEVPSGGFKPFGG